MWVMPIAYDNLDALDAIRARQEAGEKCGATFTIPEDDAYRDPQHVCVLPFGHETVSATPLTRDEWDKAKFHVDKDGVRNE